MYFCSALADFGSTKLIFEDILFYLYCTVAAIACTPWKASYGFPFDVRNTMYVLTYCTVFYPVSNIVWDYYMVNIDYE